MGERGRPRSPTLWARTRPVRPAVVGLTLVAGFLWFRGREALPVLLVVGAILLVQLALLAPAAATRVQRGADRVGRAVATGLSLILLGGVWVVVVVPVALLNRLVRIDLLGPGAGWQAGPVDARVRRGFSRER